MELWNPIQSTMKKLFCIQRWGASLTPGKAAKLQLGLALLFAVAILAASYFLRDSGYAETVVYTLVALWWVPFTVLLQAEDARRKRCR